MNISINSAFRIFSKCLSPFKTDKKASSPSEKILSKKIVPQEELQTNPIFQAQKVKNNSSDKRTLTEKFDRFGTATAQRVESIQENKNIQMRKLDYYEGLLHKKLPAKYTSFINSRYSQNPQSLVDEIRNLYGLRGKEELIAIAEEIVYAHRMLEVLEKQDVSWLASPFVRDQIRDNRPEDIPSSMINLRIQKFVSPTSKIGSFSFARHGAIQDSKDPGNTIQELELYIKEGPKSKALAAEIKRRENLITKFSKKKKNAQKAAAVTRSLIPLKQIQQGKPEAAKKLIEEKKRFTNDQMLQLVTAQINSKASLLPNVKNNAPLIMTQLSLLNEKKATVHKTGLIMDEGRMITEMSDTFKRFEGKKVIFDGKGPFIDEQGNIHSEKKLLLANNKPKQLTLKPLFTNFTVQRNTTNGKIQREINRTSLNNLHKEMDILYHQKHTELTTLKKLNNTDPKKLEALEQEFQKLKDLKVKLTAIQTKLANNQSNYGIACDYFPLLVEFTRLRQGPDALMVSGVNCFSGKDRTGIVAAVTVHRSGVKPAVQKLESDPKEQRKIISGYAHRILYDPGSIGAQVLSENTGTTIYKVSSLIIPEVSDSITTVWRRMVEYPKTATLDF